MSKPNFGGNLFGGGEEHWGFFLLCYYLIIWFALVIDSSRAPMAKQHTRFDLSGNLMTLELFRRNGDSMNVCRSHTRISFSVFPYYSILNSFVRVL